ncbi:hypothetical protein F0L68_28835 [Solihabitans fulvus]|uniref:Uncharacterized protein n=1 Tax=Solihabitans fulvus TaxID=1892852 RepID=A0A5B2WWI7_9PSEU|nr:hypothetical protein [Solihabitans fulvus]KAA2255230.1 hypothetical protein F0L68_28835 [Solihabitans fulvus]
MSRYRLGVCAAALTGALIAVAGQATASTTGWTPVSVPQFPPAGTNVMLNGVATQSATDAWAVGTSFGVAGTNPALPVYHWNGNAWSIAPTPAFPNAAGLLAVSAGSATNAWAVGFTRTGGYRGRQAIALHWNGSAWSADASLGVGVGALNGVADLGSANAWAVGDGGVVTHWNGSAWSTVSVPQPAGGFGSRLTSVSARNASDVWAVGTFLTTDSPQTRTYALHFDGTAWSLATMPLPNDPNFQTTFAVDGVAAVGANDAWAVGDVVALGGTPVGTLVEHWDGVAWSVVPAPSPAVYPVLTGVTARAANDVWAVGYGPTQAGGQSQAVTLHWDGTAWSTVPAPGSTDFSELLAVSGRTGVADTWAVGVSRNGGLVLRHQ